MLHNKMVGPFLVMVMNLRNVFSLSVLNHVINITFAECLNHIEASARPDVRGLINNRELSALDNFFLRSNIT